MVSHQIEVIVFNIIQMLFATRTVLKVGEYLSNRALFHVYIASAKQEEGWENSRQLCKPKA